MESNPRARNGEYEGAREPAPAEDLSVKFNERVTRELVLSPLLRDTLPFLFEFSFRNRCPSSIPRFSFSFPFLVSSFLLRGTSESFFEFSPTKA